MTLGIAMAHSLMLPRGYAHGRALFVVVPSHSEPVSKIEFDLWTVLDRRLVGSRTETGAFQGERGRNRWRSSGLSNFAARVGKL